MQSKKSLVLASLLLSTPACTLSPETTEDVERDALEVRARQDLTSRVFVSKTTTRAKRWVQDAGGHLVQVDVDVRHRVRFVRAGAKADPALGGADVGSYLYDGPGVMEYEVVIDTIDASDPNRAYALDSVHYAKRTGAATFRLFDCDSTHRCTDSSETARATLVRSGGRETLRITGLYAGAGTNGMFLEDNGRPTLELERTR